ncbi:hypothetical protein H920_08796 [Fukomys damarensis]|uniref:Uncharacterized protein n=1 Tax=Fukomys damarensis TaxID=885580 RepID=A0A091DCF2_FUKDA|nr:hypothetical protein H920_08796 [Fukomys damarensis]
MLPFAHPALAGAGAQDLTAENEGDDDDGDEDVLQLDAYGCMMRGVPQIREAEPSFALLTPSCLQRFTGTFLLPAVSPCGPLPNSPAFQCASSCHIAFSMSETPNPDPRSFLRSQSIPQQHPSTPAPTLFSLQFHF